MAIRCPDEIRAENHKAKNREIWKTPLWKFKVALFKTRYPYCIYCGKPTQVPHHQFLQDYGTEAYIDLYLSGCLPLCNSCHYNVGKKGYTPCPICGKLKSPKYELCWDCIPPGDRERMKTSKEVAKYRRNNLRRRLSAPTPEMREKRRHLEAETRKRFRQRHGGATA